MPTIDLLGSLTRVTPRVWVRTAFLLYFLFTCWQLWRFYQWALGNGPYVARPEATAGLVPLGAIMSVTAWLKAGVFDPVMPAALVIVIAAFAISVLLKRGFCGWVCPVGTLGAVLGWAGRALNRGRARRVHKWVDIALRSPKYVMAAMLLGWVVMIPAQVAIEFQLIPYYATSDLKILYGLLHPAWGYWALGGFVAVTSIAIGTNTWCRYLCPLGAIYGGASAASLATIDRDAESCIGCNACTKACAARIDVAKATRPIRDPECDGCQDCTRVCPVPGALNVRIGPRLAHIAIPWQFWPVLLVTIWLFIWAIALATGHWDQGLPDGVIAEYMRTMKLTHDF